MLKTKRLSIVPTFRCTLNCKLCSNHMPEFRRLGKIPPDATVEEMKSDIDKLFEIFDKIEWLQFVGGEIFSHKGLAEVYQYCHKYFHNGKFDKLIIETNATISPPEEEISILAGYGENCKVMISDYGEVSRKKDEYVRLFQENGIPYVLKKYYGEISQQHFGGWIDNTALKDYGEAEKDVIKKAQNCPQVMLENMHCFKGELYRCSNSLFIGALGLYPPKRGDFVDLNDSSLSIKEKREIIDNFYVTPRISCRYCSWKNADNAERFSACEQEKVE